MRLRHDMNLSFKTQGVKESLTMALSYLCCALLLCLSARYWYWAKVRETSEKVDLLPASAGFANHCWLLNYLALSFVFFTVFEFTMIPSFPPSCLRRVHWNSYVSLRYAALGRDAVGWTRRHQEQRWLVWCLCQYCAPIQVTGRTNVRAIAMAAGH